MYKTFNYILHNCESPSYHEAKLALHVKHRFKYNITLPENG